MTDDEKLKMLKALSDESDEKLLSAYLTMAKNMCLRKRFPYGDGTETLDKKYDDIQINVALYLYDKRGAEGETRHTEDDVDRTYDSAYVPDSYFRGIVPLATTPKDPNYSLADNENNNLSGSLFR